MTIQAQANQDADLNAEQRMVFMDVISESLRLSQRSHLFNWLQGGFQFLISHEVMIFGIKSGDSEEYRYEYFSSSRYFDDNRFADVLKSSVGVVTRAEMLWQNTRLPIIISNQAPATVLTAAVIKDSKKYTNMHVLNEELLQTDLLSGIAHGFGDSQNHVSSFVVFARLAKPPKEIHAQLLELVMPHLHCALLRVANSRPTVSTSAASQISKKITEREIEILQWVHMGKTNWEISSILDISPLTVKNHVQNILRKLDVQNRGQAAVKAAKLGLVKLFN